MDLASSFISYDKEEAFRYAKTQLEVFFRIFGIKVKQAKRLPEEFEKMIRERAKAKASKDFKKADSIRTEVEIKFNGVMVDTGNGVTFIEKSI